MILEIDDWKFDVDVAATMEYSAREAAGHCDCGYCRNFYAAVDDTYPNLRPFLAQFGLNIEAPDELMPYDFEEEMLYDVYYAVCGKVLKYGKKLFETDGAVVEPDGHNALLINTLCPEPYFFLNISTITLPWVLEEPMEDVVSPANEPSFLKRMWNKLLGKDKNDSLYS